MRKSRNSAFEVLRIVAIIMIIFSHYSFHGEFNFSNDTTPINYLFLKNITLGAVGVDLFILIFGYFSIGCTSINWNRILKLELQVLFYSILSLLVALVFDKQAITAGEIARSIFPTVLGRYWFFSAYIVFYFLSPYFNKLLQNMNINQYRKFLVTMFVFWGGVPTITGKTIAGSDFTLFLYLYSVGAYLRLHGDFKAERKHGLMLAGVSWGAIISSTILIYLFGESIGFIRGKESFFVSQTSVLVVGIAIGLLVVAMRTPVFSNRVINTIAGCTFGIYLAHDNALMRHLLWGKLFNNKLYYDSPLLILHCLGSVFVVFLVCMIVELLRQKTLEKMIDLVIDRTYKKLNPKR